VSRSATAKIKKTFTTNFVALIYFQIESEAKVSRGVEETVGDGRYFVIIFCFNFSLSENIF
jgi:hypothetical protein